MKNANTLKSVIMQSLICINYAEEQTNEEWFCSLPTEEKADWLSSLMWWMYPFFPAEERVEHNKKQILEWLKEVHK